MPGKSLKFWCVCVDPDYNVHGPFGLKSGTASDAVLEASTVFSGMFKNKESGTFEIFSNRALALQFINSCELNLLLSIATRFPSIEPICTELIRGVMSLFCGVRFANLQNVPVHVSNRIRRYSLRPDQFVIYHGKEMAIGQVDVRKLELTLGNGKQTVKNVPILAIEAGGDYLN